MKLAAFSKHHKVTRQFSCRARSRSTVAPRETRGRDAAERGTRAIDCRQLRVVPPVRVSGTGGSRRHGCSGSRWHLGMDRAGAAPWPPASLASTTRQSSAGCSACVAGWLPPVRDALRVQDGHTTIGNRGDGWFRRGVGLHLIARNAAAGPGRGEPMPDAARVTAHRSASDGRGGGLRPSAASRAGSPARSIARPMVGADRLRTPRHSTLDPRHPTDRAGIRLALTLRQPVVPPKRPITDATSDAQSLRDWLETREWGGASAPYQSPTPLRAVRCRAEGVPGAPANRGGRQSQANSMSAVGAWTVKPGPS